MLLDEEGYPVNNTSMFLRRVITPDKVWDDRGLFDAIANKLGEPVAYYILARDYPVHPDVPLWVAQEQTHPLIQAHQNLVDRWSEADRKKPGPDKNGSYMKLPELTPYGNKGLSPSTAAWFHLLGVNPNSVPPI